MEPSIHEFDSHLALISTFNKHFSRHQKKSITMPLYINIRKSEVVINPKLLMKQLARWLIHYQLLKTLTSIKLNGNSLRLPNASPCLSYFGDPAIYSDMDDFTHSLPTFVWQTRFSVVINGTQWLWGLLLYNCLPVKHWKESDKDKNIYSAIISIKLMSEKSD